MAMAIGEESTSKEEHDYEGLPPNYSVGANMVAGAFAGIAEHTLMFPADFLKTRLQVISPPSGGLYNGVMDAISKINKTEGYKTMYRGITSVFVGAGPAHAMHFLTYESVKQAFGGNEDKKHHPFVGAVSGASATIAGDALMTPFDVVKQRMQVHGSVFKSIAQCTKSVYKSEGLAAFYVSYPTTLCMSVPFTALFVPVYESISKVMNPMGRYDVLTHCVAGSIGGAFAASVTTPLDVIKTLLQTRGTANEAEVRAVKGIFEAVTIIKRRHGLKGFFRGLGPRVVTIMPSNAICWLSYETAKAYFIRRAEEKGP